MARILVVDDEPHLRELLVDALSGQDLQVTSAASGAEAMRLAQSQNFDLVVTDLLLEDCQGTDVVDRLRCDGNDIPAVVITGQHDPQALSNASRIRPVEMMTKPLDIDHLRRTVRDELDRQADKEHRARRARRLESLAHRGSKERREAKRQLQATSDDLSTAYRTLNGRIADQKTLIDYQQELIAARTDDEVFKVLFRTFVRQSGPVYGAAMVCNSEAELQMVGRFGVPVPDNSNFCKALAAPILDAAVEHPRCFTIDAGEDAHMFPPFIHRYLAGVSILAIPLIPADGELIGLVVLYRKGEQPFVKDDCHLASMIAPATAKAIARND
ncbi:MAG: response regulator [Phycisphaerae bacterium]|jgi:CheY-like chemotaxis protein